MRWIVIAAVAAMYSWGVSALPAENFEAAAGDVAPLVISSETIVTITPIPPPASVTEFRTDLPPVRKLKVAKKRVIPKSMLSRTERHQLALLAPKHQGDAASLHNAANEEDAGSGMEDLDLHRFFSRPKLTELEDQDDEDVDGNDLSDMIKLRLFLARMKAVQAHQNKFS